MKINNLILLVSLLIMGSQVVSSQSKTGDLPGFLKKLSSEEVAPSGYGGNRVCAFGDNR